MMSPGEPPASLPSRRIGRRLDIGRFVLWAITLAVVVFLLAPIVIVVITSFTEDQSVDLSKSTLKWYVLFINTIKGAPGTRPGLAGSIQLSLVLGVVTALIAVVAGVMAALALHRYRFPGRELARGAIPLPIIYPQLVMGVGLLLVFSEFRLFTPFVRLLIGHIVIVLPFVMISVDASLRVYEESLEQAARTLGANSWRVFFHITLPLISPGVIAAAIFAFITSVTQFTVSYFLYSGRTLPLPIWIFQAIHMRQDPLTAVVSVFLILVAVLAVLGLDRLIGIRRILGR